MSKSIKLKNNTYIDSTSIVDNKNTLKSILTYSTTEQQIGTWIDGKPIYRKVSNLSANISAGENYYDTGISNMETLISSKLYFKFDNNWYLDWNASEDGLRNKIYYVSLNKIRINSGASLIVQKMFLITEYTKTTD